MDGKGIRVNAVCPGPIWTPLIPSTMDDEGIESFTSPMGRPVSRAKWRPASCFSQVRIAASCLDDA